ncbi:hypothetical protein CTI12_AA269550 [Artemisia annua]|uniref:Glabrous enhancer-binding protein-like DBD domain-containing protein n=1 Tax=Artemisia annua TaxID=35608 RepID=A0A2U1NG77_ARTAN|nr:hypothetical protein CTI12_AA269550 [Artemisia annua]
MDHSSITQHSAGSSRSKKMTDKVKDIYITPRKHQDIATRIAMEAARDPYAIISPGKKQEINLLVDLLEYHKYPLDNASDMREFFNFWIQKREVYVTVEVFIDKVTELHERFLDNKHRTLSSDEDFKEWMDKNEVKIYRLSDCLWGKKDDREYDNGGGYDDQNYEPSNYHQKRMKRISLAF